MLSLLCLHLTDLSYHTLSPHHLFPHLLCPFPHTSSNHVDTSPVCIYVNPSCSFLALKLYPWHTRWASCIQWEHNSACNVYLKGFHIFTNYILYLLYLLCIIDACSVYFVTKTFLNPPHKFFWETKMLPFWWNVLGPIGKAQWVWFLVFLGMQCSLNVSWGLQRVSTSVKFCFLWNQFCWL